MVEEIVRIEPQLFGAQIHQISIARKMELWRRIVDQVNAEGQYPRTRGDIRKRWNDLRGKDKMGQVIDIMQENQRLQEEHHQEIKKELQALNTIMISIAGVLDDMANIMREYTSHQRAPSTSQSTD
ncbi:hypothetical protein NDU88_005938 [Pleurodeles waltl]|uniref:Myb/SANT-like DNA-binding domain-containing protein n=1 Tax=Pleurodeles waltl TaxID=8319 RepID=A0AAV7SN39_PLEWA|nr:hypothetical protein NDU88_005938 [Pleurodeles waltl]